MEKMPGGNLLDYILERDPPRLTESDSKFIIFQVLVGLKKLHRNMIAHCDLKPENILLSEKVPRPHVKICDFGYAKIIGPTSFRKSIVGTPAYSAPEVHGTKRIFNNSIDMWSMGVITYITMCGNFPFDVEDDPDFEQLENPDSFLFSDPIWESISWEAKDIITQLLKVKIERRMTVDHALMHRWFTGDTQLYLDLEDLEKKVNIKWLTDDYQAEKSIIEENI